MSGPPTVAAPSRFPHAVRSWAVAQSSARAEKVVARELGRLDVPCFLPLHRKRRQYGGRIRESWLPLFPGYVFYDQDAVERRRVFDVGHVCNVLLPDEPEVLRADLATVARALEIEPELARRDTLPPGTPVRVTEGAFAGFEGLMVRARTRTTLIILVHFINYGAEVTIDAAFVEPLA